MVFFCRPKAELEKSTERVFDEYAIHKNALRAYAVEHAPFEQIKSEGDASAWSPVFEGHHVIHLFCNTVSLKSFVESSDDTCWVAVQGTLQEGANDTPETLLVESELVWSRELKVYMHKGVKKIADDLYQTVAPQLVKAKFVRITGHSVGGAAAQALAYRLLLEGFKLETVVTFGAPKWTNRKGAKRVAQTLGATALRVTADADPVPLLIPPSLNIGSWLFRDVYTHVGAELALAAAAPAAAAETALPSTGSTPPAPPLKAAKFLACGAVHGKEVDKEEVTRAETAWANVSWSCQDEQSRMISYLRAIKPAMHGKLQFNDMFCSLTQ